MAGKKGEPEIDYQWLQVESDKCFIRENLPFFLAIRNNQYIKGLIPANQSRRAYKMGLTYRGTGNGWPLKLTDYTEQLLTIIQEEKN